MDQTAPLSDLLFREPSFPSVAPASANGGAVNDLPEGDLFSALVSEPEASTNTPLAQNAETTTLPTAPLPLSETSEENRSNASLFGQIGQTLAEIRSTLHQALAVLRSGRADVSALAAEGTGQADVLDSMLSETPEEGFSAVADALTSPEADQLLSSLSSIVTDLTGAAQVAETSEGKSYSDVIGELLALMQLVVQTLQQAATGEGTNAGLESAVADEVLNGLIPEEIAPPGLLALQPADSSAADSLLDLLKAAAADAKQVLGALARADDDSTEAAMDALFADAAAEETGVSLAQIETDIKAVLADLKEKTPAFIAQKEAPSSAQKAAEAAQGTVPPFPAAQTAAEAAVALPTTGAKTVETKPFITEKIKTAAVKTENLTESQKAADPLISTLAGGLTDGDFSSASDWLEDENKNASLSGWSSDLSAAFTAEGAQAKGVYSFASTLSAFRAANGGLKGLPSIADQVVLHMNRSVKNGESQMSLQLQPSDMGKISVKLDFGADGKVQGTVVADNPKTLEMLQKDSRSLERALQDAGLRAEPGSLEFSLSGRESQNNAGQTADGTGSGTGDGTISAGNEGGEIVDIGAISETYYITPNGVNIRV